MGDENLEGSLNGGAGDEGEGKTKVSCVGGS